MPKNKISIVAKCKVKTKQQVSFRVIYRDPADKDAFTPKMQEAICNCFTHLCTVGISEHNITITINLQNNA